MSPLVSLANQGAETSYLRLKQLYDGIEYLKSTPSQGLLVQDLPFRKDALILAYSDASWCNASRSGLQIGLMVGMTSSRP